MIITENIVKVQNQLKNYGIRIKSEVSYVILKVGDEIVLRLQERYPDLTISSNYFPQSMEYWIGISRLGRVVTWIKCPVSNLFFTRERDAFGKQEFKSTVPELNIDALIIEIVNELSLQINQIVGRKV